jgi:hypothetical protein
MRWSLSAVALAALLDAPASAAAPIDVVRDCAATVPAISTGIRDMSAACPGIEEAIRSSGLEPLLYDGWRQRLSRDALRDVVGLRDAYGGSAPSQPVDSAALAGVLRDLSREQSRVPPTWWEAFKAWLHEWLRSHHAGSLTWLDRWLDSLQRSLTVLNVLSYSLLGLVLIAAAIIIVNEMRAAGLIHRRRPRPGGAVRRPAPAPAAADAPAESLPLGDRLSSLLRLLVARLMQTGRLQSERSLTHRELVARARLDSEAQRLAFAAVAFTAESLLYGGVDAQPERLSSVLREGRTLLAELPDSDAH